MLLAAVGFFDGHVKIACSSGGGQIGDLERPRRHFGLIDNVTILTDGDQGIAAGNPSNHRRIVTYAGRQHVIIRGHLKTTKRHAIEDISWC